MVLTFDHLSAHRETFPPEQKSNDTWSKLFTQTQAFDVRVWLKRIIIWRKQFAQVKRFPPITKILAWLKHFHMG